MIPVNNVGQYLCAISTNQTIMLTVCSPRLYPSENVPSSLRDHTPAAQQPSAVSAPAPPLTPAPAHLRAHSQRDARQHQQRIRDGALHPAAEETPPQPDHLHRAAALGLGEEIPETKISLHSRQVSSFKGTMASL